MATGLLQSWNLGQAAPGHGGGAHFLFNKVVDPVSSAWPVCLCVGGVGRGSYGNWAQLLFHGHVWVCVVMCMCTRIIQLCHVMID